jgi:hypothetical protein
MPRSEHRTLKSVHLAGTIWFILCVGFILVLALRQAGVNWWIIFSLSGPSALIILLLVSLYLFAVFRGAGASQKIELEHPLTSTDYYMMFYVVAPFLGALAGCLGMMGVSRIAQFLLGVALGTLSSGRASGNAVAGKPEPSPQTAGRGQSPARATAERP